MHSPRASKTHVYAIAACFAVMFMLIPASQAYQSDDTLLTSAVNSAAVTSYITRSYETVREVIPAERIEKSADDLVRGQSRLISAGKDGEKVCLYEISSSPNGYYSKKLVVESVISEPVSSVYEVGGGTITTASGEVLSYSRVIHVKAYSYTTEGRKNPQKARTATGTVPRVGTVSVDPKVIPYGTKMYITSEDGKSWVYGKGTAEDCGNFSGNEIDLFRNTVAECRAFGVRKAKVYILD